MIRKFAVMTASRCCAGETHAGASSGPAEAGPITSVSKGRFLVLQGLQNELFLQRLRYPYLPLTHGSIPIVNNL